MPQTPEIHRYEQMPRLARMITAVSPRFAKANRPTRGEIERATDGRSIWRLACLLIRDRLPRRAH